MLEACPLDEASQLAKQICELVKDFRFTWEGKSFTTGISIGIVAIGVLSESIHSVLSAADAACYVAKEMGRNRVHVYRANDEAVTKWRGDVQWVSDIQAAMEERRLRLHFQPIEKLNGSASDVGHFEVLLRMTGRNGHDISPRAFIPAAERYDLMVTLDRWVSSETFQWLSRDRQRLDEVSICSINLSGQSLVDGGLHEFIKNELRQNKLPASKICFEITETAAVSRLDRVIQLIGLLKKQGFHFALDDFGTGLSNVIRS